MKLYKEFKSTKNKNFDTVELTFSRFFTLSGNEKWFCRIWSKYWLEPIMRKRMKEKTYGESYGKNKFEAYRLALKDLKIN